MRKYLILVTFALCLGGLAYADMVRTWAKSFNGNGSAPLRDCTDAGNSGAQDGLCGLSLAGAKGFRVCITTPDGGQMQDAGSVRLFIFNPTTARWAEDPGLTLNVGVAATAQCWPDFQTVAANGRVYGIPSGIATFPDSGVQIDITATYPSIK